MNVKKKQRNSTLLIEDVADIVGTTPDKNNDTTQKSIDNSIDS